MANRLSKIYTRAGDNGKTSLADGSRISKSGYIFEVIGDVDELNSHIGMAKCIVNDSNDSQNQPADGINITPAQANIDLQHSLTVIQHLLFNLGGELAMFESEFAYQGIETTHIDWLEHQIDTMNAELQPLKDFILPAGTALMCQLHISRSVCRRAERHAIKLQAMTENTALHQTGIQFLNRLSDWLFVASRFAGLEQSSQQTNEILWNNAVLEQLL